MKTTPRVLHSSPYLEELKKLLIGRFDFSEPRDQTLLKKLEVLQLEYEVRKKYFGDVSLTPFFKEIGGYISICIGMRILPKEHPLLHNPLTRYQLERICDGKPVFTPPEPSIKPKRTKPKTASQLKRQLKSDREYAKMLRSKARSRAELDGYKISGGASESIRRSKGISKCKPTHRRCLRCNKDISIKEFSDHQRSCYQS